MGIKYGSLADKIKKLDNANTDGDIGIQDLQF